MGAHSLVSIADKCSPNPTQISVDANRPNPLIEHWPRTGRGLLRKNADVFLSFRAASSLRGRPDVRMGSRDLRRTGNKEQRTENRDQRPEIRDQRSEIRDQRSENRDQRSEIRDQRTENRDQRTENRDQRTEIREQRTENREQRTEIRDQKFVRSHPKRPTTPRKKTRPRGPRCAFRMGGTRQ